jgi:hypothetical protein
MMINLASVRVGGWPAKTTNQSPLPLLLSAATPAPQLPRTCCTNVSYTPRCTMKRSPLAQFWPQLRKAALMAMGTTCACVVRCDVV